MAHDVQLFGVRVFVYANCWNRIRNRTRTRESDPGPSVVSDASRWARRYDELHSLWPRTSIGTTTNDFHLIRGTARQTEDALIRASVTNKLSEGRGCTKGCTWPAQSPRGRQNANPS